MASRIFTVLAASSVVFLPISCSRRSTTAEVVVYTSVDRPYSEPVLKRFQEGTGIRVKAVYDLEAAKTTGLVNRLIAEKEHPQADVFWNGEFVQTLLLKEEGVLSPYASPEEEDATFRDPESFWTGFGGRARVFLVNTELLAEDDFPSSVFDLLDPRRSPETFGVAHPLFGTTATHAAALYALMGPDEARSFFSALRQRGVQILEGNAAVRDAVVHGRIEAGLTDTDDACGAIRRGEKVAAVFPDQEDGELGTLVIPNTVAVIRGGSNPEEAKKLVDFLLSTDTEEALLESGWFQISTRGLAPSSGCVLPPVSRTMQVELPQVFQALDLARRDLAEIFVR